MHSSIDVGDRNSDIDSQALRESVSGTERGDGDAHRAPEPQPWLNLFIDLAASLQRDDASRAEQLATRAEIAAIRNGQPAARAKALAIRAGCALASNESEKAVRLADKAMHVARALGDVEPGHEVNAYAVQGASLEAVGRLAEALEAYDRGASCARAAFDATQRVELLTRIAAIYRRLDDGRGAIAVHAEAELAFESLVQERSGPDRALAMARMRNRLEVGRLYRCIAKEKGDEQMGEAALQNLDAALAATYEALEMAKQSGEDAIVLQALDLCAQLHLARGRRQSAARAIELARSYLLAHPIHSELPELDITCAEWLLAEGRSRDAARLVRARLDSDSPMIAMDEQRRALSVLAQAHAAAQKFELAFAAQNELSQLDRRLRAATIEQQRMLLFTRLQRERQEDLHFLSHDLKATMGAVVSELNGAREAETLPEEVLRKMQRRAGRASEMIDTHLALLRSNLLEDKHFADIDLNELVDDVCEEVGAVAASRGVRIDCNWFSGAVVWGNREFLHRALVNLLQNCVRYSPEGSTIAVVIIRKAKLWGVRISDTGPGFHGAQHRSSASGAAHGAENGGSGFRLGLVFVRRVAERHRGVLRIEDRKPTGARIDLFLPASHENSMRSSPSCESSFSKTTTSLHNPSSAVFGPRALT